MNVTSLSFPYGESIQWFSPDKIAQLPDNPLKEWILAKGSLTKRLKKCGTHFEVKVLGEDFLPPLEGEYPNQTQVWVREVLLCVDSEPWVFARTLIPAQLFSSREQDFVNLGTRSLGELLYANDNFVPGKVEVAHFSNQSRLAQLASTLSQPTAESLWGRRRYFCYQEHQMIVCEAFLPKAQQAIQHLKLPQ
ncbi:chorismate--pyruvate lyase family protein [Shewanella gelidii]|uniref:Probable chorismate pyruvate-lyase n=1 Tax=Shewanella gelidii TaxID=1642821 RepID=A0A917ND07_9GAMM|nr:chorismate lyase [Shewanella gelidii]MCL1098924.1 chorismate lyase [Shewanella gelidii]GGI89995.1 putative chorismate pyruvate-lyase [Shewanella gelidii]